MSMFKLKITSAVKILFLMDRPLEKFYGFALINEVIAL